MFEQIDLRNGRGREGGVHCTGCMLLIEIKKLLGIFLTRDGIAELLSVRILWLMCLKTIYFFVWKHDFFPNSMHVMQMKNKLSVMARADSAAEYHIQILQSLLCQSVHGKGWSCWWNRTSEGSTFQTSLVWSKGLRYAEKCAVLPCQYRD